MITEQQIFIGGMYRRVHGKGFTDHILNLDILQKILDPNNNEYAFNDFYCIELNNEWFNAFNFEEIHIGFSFKLGDFQIDFRDGKYFYFFENYRDWVDPIDLKYVHQLQQLYFAFKNKYLTLKQENG